MRYTIVLLLLSVAGFGQTGIVRGKILQPTRDSVELQIPWSEHPHPEDSYWAKVQPDGTFQFSVKIPASRMGFLLYDGKEQLIFLMAKFPLEVTFAKRDGEYFTTFDGPGSRANNYLNNKWDENLIYDTLHFSRLSVDSVVSRAYLSINYHLDLFRQEMLDSLDIGDDNVELIESELRYAYYYRFSGYCQTVFYQRKDMVGEEMWDYLSVLLAKFPGMPTATELAGSFSAKIWLDEYGKMRYEHLLRQSRTIKDKAESEKAFGDSVKMSPANERAWRALYGDGYVYGVQRGNILPKYARDIWAAEELYLSCEKVYDVKLAKDFLEYLKKTNPVSPLVVKCEGKIKRTEREIFLRSKNPRVHFREVENPTIGKLVAPYKGKLVFIDIWGSWCYPCIKDMAYSQELKAHYKDSNIVFLYVATENAKDSARWKDVAYTVCGSGEHVRLSVDESNRLFAELNIGNMSYPHYVIIDKQGQVAVPNANRPYEREELYADIRKYLYK